MIEQVNDMEITTKDILISISNILLNEELISEDEHVKMQIIIINK
jgi:hypothetical protein